MMPLGSIDVVFEPQLLRTSRDFIHVEADEHNRAFIIAYSKEVLFLHLAQQQYLRRVAGGWPADPPHFPAWHDSKLNCATWTDHAGCRCEVEP